VNEATEWFDQPAFSPWLLDVQGIQGNEQWCARHWAPCPVMGANGIKAAVMLASAVMSAGLNSVDGPLCCQLGDQEMFDIWGQCPPTRDDQP
jgi:hypothetical protein